MAHIFKHKQSNSLYTIEHLLNDIRFANRGSRTGIYATPYGWNGKVIEHTIGQLLIGEINSFNPDKFVDDNFEIISEI